MKETLCEGIFAKRRAFTDGGKKKKIIFVLGKAVCVATGEAVAVKQLDRMPDIGEKWEERLKYELEAHSSVSSRNCSNVCKLIEIIPGDDHVFLVMELCGGQQLFDLVASSPKRRLSESLAAEITRQLVTGANNLFRLYVVVKFSLFFGAKKKNKECDVFTTRASFTAIW